VETQLRNKHAKTPAVLIRLPARLNNPANSGAVNNEQTAYRPPGCVIVSPHNAAYKANHCVLIQGTTEAECARRKLEAMAEEARHRRQ
jgi:hypothetical protein